MRPECETGSHTKPLEKSPHGPRCTSEFFESDASPSGGFLLKGGARLSLGLGDSHRMEGGRPLGSQRYVPSLPSPAFFRRRGENGPLPSGFGEREMGTQEADWLNRTVFALADLVRPAGSSGFLKVDLIDTEQCHITGHGGR